MVIAPGRRSEVEVAVVFSLQHGDNLRAGLVHKSRVWNLALLNRFSALLQLAVLLLLEQLVDSVLRGHTDPTRQHEFLEVVLVVLKVLDFATEVHSKFVFVQSELELSNATLDDCSALNLRLILGQVVTAVGHHSIEAVLQSAKDLWRTSVSALQHSRDSGGRDVAQFAAVSVFAN